MIKSLSTLVVLYLFLGDFIATGGLSKDVLTWTHTFENSDFCDYWTVYYCKEQLKKANSKSNALSGKPDIQAAIQIVNIYTSPYPKTFEAVNKFMRGQSDYPDDENMFKEYIDLMKRSYDLLCAESSGNCKTHKVVFRGQTFVPEDIQEGSPYTFETFISTSLKMKKAQEFAEGNIIFTIKSAKGLALEKYTSVKKEDEILIMPPLKMSVDIYLKDGDDSEIESRSKDYGGTYWYPDYYVEGKIETQVISHFSTSQGSKTYGTFIIILMLCFVVSCIILV